ncbi:hypothetical protein GETHPA_29310 [Geothrix rubra]|uniref:Outer membrane lipoprotein carrier protein LolA n=1 Tax=Geothrix rubra TaxID=2927977 RepID=A0ABQ5Q9K6_9BACT|nr:outer-membrane lipoprotein carrier protein LolA [Geothrix rubra]GLH71397.1 hypothetical protein GETHPA_29310 [Geothrix rubra]
MRRSALVLLTALPCAAALPAWWRELPRKPALAARFTQESDSAVFGKLSQTGTLVLARGGRLRVDYASGLRVLADGRELVQYDPDTRTAQRMDLIQAVRDFPLLGLLLEPARIGLLFRPEALPGEGVRLVPREPGLPEVHVEGRNGLLKALTWTDPTGARQRLELVDPRVPPTPSPATFRFDPPPGTRWATAGR